MHSKGGFINTNVKRVDYNTLEEAIKENYILSPECKEENKEKGNLEVKQVNINRNRAFDILMADIKGGHLKKIRSEDDELWIDHLTDMKRVQKFNRDNELEYQWVKSSKPEDHYHHSLVYAQTAARMLGVETFKVPRGSLLGKMKIKPKY